MIWRPVQYTSFIRALDLSSWRMILCFPALPAFFSRSHTCTHEMRKLFELSYCSFCRRRPLLAFIIRLRVVGGFLSFLLSWLYTSPGFACLCLALFVCVFSESAREWIKIASLLKSSEREWENITWLRCWRVRTACRCSNTHREPRAPPMLGTGRAVPP